ncbi:hypothetical protein PO596_24755, partial [Escherichia coli]
KTSIFSHPVYLFLRKFSLQDSRGGSFSEALQESEFFSQILHSQTQLSTPWQWPKYEVAQDH